MNGMDWNLDELVSKVMADLRKSSTESAASQTSAALTRDFRSLHAETESNASGEPTQEAEEPIFAVTERVLVADVVLRLASKTDAKRWSVLPGAVVTPSAKDELKKRGIELVLPARKADVAKAAASSASRVTLSASNVGASYLPARNAAKSEPSQTTRVLAATHLPAAERFPAAVMDYLTRNAETTEIRLDCLKETSKKIAEEVNKDKSLKVVLTTHDAAIGSIWANRLSGVRAVVAYTFEQAKRDLAATNANVLIVDPRDVGPYPFRQIVDYFLH